MNLRHAAALALVGWNLMMPVSVLATNTKSKLATYTNKTYGISFKYPSDWTLKEGDEAKLNWGYLGEVHAHLPQGVAIVALEMPANSYSGSDFQMAFLNTSVDTSLSAALCNWGSPEVKVGLIEFTKHEDGEGGMNRVWNAEYYHVFRNRTCYEFQLGLGAGGYGVVEGIRSHVDQKLDHRAFEYHRSVPKT